LGQTSPDCWTLGEWETMGEKLREIAVDIGGRGMR
jgi:hypothetical protein